MSSHSGGYGAVRRVELDHFGKREPLRVPLGGSSKVVQVQMAQGNAAAVIFGQTHGQQGLET